MTTHIDMLAIGDVVTDAFIRLKDADVHCELDNTDCKLCVRYGDKVPYESVEICTAVGNSANAAVSGARLGIHTALLSAVGKDKNGEEALAELQKNGVDTQYVAVEDGKKTNYHYVLWYDVDRTILIKHEDFNYSIDDVEPPQWVYLSSLGEHTLPFHEKIAAYLAAHPDVRLAFQPGTFQIKFGVNALRAIYQRTDVFFCNVDEAQRILGETSRDLRTLLTQLAALGPKTVIITDGMNGAYAYESSKPEDVWFMPVYPHDAFERTGAGDAFASTVISALILGKPLLEALTWGPVNSMSVVQEVGAQKGLLSREKLEHYLATAPEDYVVKRV